MRNERTVMEILMLRHTDIDEHKRRAIEWYLSFSTSTELFETLRSIAWDVEFCGDILTRVIAAYRNSVEPDEVGAIRGRDYKLRTLFTEVDLRILRGKYYGANAIYENSP